MIRFVFMKNMKSSIFFYTHKVFYCIIAAGLKLHEGESNRK